MSKIYNFTTRPLTRGQLDAGICELPADKHRIVQNILQSSRSIDACATSLAIIANNIGARSCLIDPGKLAIPLDVHLSCRGIGTNLRCDL